jgi:hypothetical protein
MAATRDRTNISSFLFFYFVEIRQSIFDWSLSDWPFGQLPDKSTKRENNKNL